MDGPFILASIQVPAGFSNENNDDFYIWYINLFDFW